MKIASNFLMYRAAIFVLVWRSFTAPAADASVTTLLWIPPPQGISPVDAIYSFAGNLDGFRPNSVIFDDRTGVLYGTTVLGGLYYAVCESAGGGCGGLFKMNPATGHITTLYSFTGGADGAFPAGALVEDSAGILYGATSFRNGTIFKLDPATNTLSTLYAFTGGADGGIPNGPLLIGSDGSLYGTMHGAGGKPYGAVFKFNPATKRLSTLYAFSDSDGAQPSGRLIYGQTESVIYGATLTGGANGGGTVFKLSPAAGTLTTLGGYYSNATSRYPNGGLALEPGGAVYGAAAFGGITNDSTCLESCGVIFKVHR